MKIFAIVMVVTMFFAGCTTAGPIIAPCTGACVGPYD